MTKVCPICKLEKDLSDFNSQGKYCKVCHNKKGKAWKLNNLSKFEESQSKYLLNKTFSETKICCKCDTEKPISEFSIKKTKYSSKCKECQNIYSKEHYKNNKTKYLERNVGRKINIRAWYKDYKSSLFCAICGETESVCLDFHHVDPEQKESAIGMLVNHTASLDTIQKELIKCVVLCANCHRKIHSNLVKLPDA